MATTGMSIERDADGNEWYPEPEPLTTEEAAWLKRKLQGEAGRHFCQPGDAHEAITGWKRTLHYDHQRKQRIFQAIWSPQFEENRHYTHDHWPEADCSNTNCIAARITNKLHLHSWESVTPLHTG